MTARYGCIRKRVLLKVDINGHLLILSESTKVPFEFVKNKATTDDSFFKSRRMAFNMRKCCSKPCQGK